MFERYLNKLDDSTPKPKVPDWSNTKFDKTSVTNIFSLFKSIDREYKEILINDDSKSKSMAERDNKIREEKIKKEKEQKVEFHDEENYDIATFDPNDDNQLLINPDTGEIIEDINQLDPAQIAEQAIVDKNNQEILSDNSLQKEDELQNFGSNELLKGLTRREYRQKIQQLEKNNTSNLDKEVEEPAKADTTTAFGNEDKHLLNSSKEVLTSESVVSNSLENLKNFDKANITSEKVDSDNDSSLPKKYKPSTEDIKVVDKCLDDLTTLYDKFLKKQNK